MIHKCAQVKSDILLETIIETYRRKYVQVMLEQASEENKSNEAYIKNLEHEAKKNIQDWCNQVTNDENGFFAIHFACFVGHSAIIRLLYKYGAELHVKNKLGLTPVHVAA